MIEPLHIILTEILCESVEYFKETDRLSFSDEKFIDEFIENVVTNFRDELDYQKEKDKAHEVPGVAAAEIAYALDRMTVLMTKLTENITNKTSLKENS